MNKTLRQILGVMFFFIICEGQNNVFANEDELDIVDFFGRVLPLSQRHDRTQDQLCLKIKNDVRYYVRYHEDQPLLPNAIPFSKNEYIQREGISKIFKSLL